MKEISCKMNHSGLWCRALLCVTLLFMAFCTVCHADEAPAAEEYTQLLGTWEVENRFPGEPDEIELTETTLRLDSRLYNARYSGDQIEATDQKGNTVCVYRWKMYGQDTMELTWQTPAEGVDDDTWDSHTASYRRTGSHSGTNSGQFLDPTLAADASLTGDLIIGKWHMDSTSNGAIEPGIENYLLFDKDTVRIIKESRSKVLEDHKTGYTVEGAVVSIEGGARLTCTIAGTAMRMESDQTDAQGNPVIFDFSRVDTVIAMPVTYPAAVNGSQPAEEQPDTDTGTQEQALESESRGAAEQPPASGYTVSLPADADQYICNEADYEWSLVRNSSNEVIIDKYTGQDALIRIPDTIDGKEVTEIGIAFAGQQQIRGVIMGRHVRTINTGAFSQCANLTDLFLNDTLTTIDFQAFSECRSLRSVILPPNLKKMWSLTFADCENLESVEFTGTLEDEVKMLANDPSSPGGFFNGCRKLREVIYPNDHLVFRDHMLIAQSDTTSPVLISYTGTEDMESFTVPEMFLNNGINQTAFGRLPLSELVFPDTNLCPECRLTLWNVRAGRLYLGSNLLLEQVILCSELSEITVSSANRCGLYMEDGVLFSRSADEVRLICYPPKMAGSDSYQVPEGVTVIAGYSGFGYSSLKEIRLSGTVRTIEQNALTGMNSLKDLYLPESVNEIGLTVIPKDCVFHTVEGSEADRYCRQRNWNVVSDLSPRPTPVPTARRIERIFIGYTLPEGHILHRGYEDFRAGFSLELNRDGTLKSVEEMAEGNEVYYGTWTKEGSVIHLKLPKLSGLESTIRISGSEWSGTFYNTRAGGKLPEDADAFFEQAAGLQQGTEVDSESPELHAEEYSQTPDKELTDEIERAPAQTSVQVESLPAENALPGNPLTGGKRQVPVSSVQADSYIIASRESYPPENMIDGDETTAWQFSTKESKLKETYVYFTFSAPQTVDELWIKNGFWRMTAGKDQYTRNCRIRDLGISFLYDGSSEYTDKKTIKLKDDKKRKDWQKISLGTHEHVIGIRFRIMSIYKGTKFKNDVCVSEVMFTVSE